MKLTRLRKVGRFKNPDTDNFVNVYKGRRAGYGDSWYFYLYRNQRQFINESDFFKKWKKQV